MIEKLTRIYLWLAIGCTIIFFAVQLIPVLWSLPIWVDAYALAGAVIFWPATLFWWATIKIWRWYQNRMRVNMVIEASFPPLPDPMDRWRH